MMKIQKTLVITLVFYGAFYGAGAFAFPSSEGVCKKTIADLNSADPSEGSVLIRFAKTSLGGGLEERIIERLSDIPPVAAHAAQVRRKIILDVFLAGYSSSDIAAASNMPLKDVLYILNNEGARLSQMQRFVEGKKVQTDRL